LANERACITGETALFQSLGQNLGRRLADEAHIRAPVIGGEVSGCEAAPVQFSCIGRVKDRTNIGLAGHQSRRLKRPDLVCLADRRHHG